MALGAAERSLSTRQLLTELPLSRVGRASGVPERTLKDVRAGTDPHPSTAAKLQRAAELLARQVLRAAGRSPSQEARHTLGTWAGLSASARVAGALRCQAPGCSEPLTGRQRLYCSEAHRKAAERASARAAEARTRARARRSARASARAPRRARAKASRGVAGAS